MRGVRVLVRAILGVAIVAGGVSGAVLPAYADAAVAPGVPTRVVTSNATVSSVVVSWSAPSSDGGAAISSYTIQYRQVGKGSLMGGSVSTPSTETSATVTGLNSGSTYVFQVAAVNTAGTSGWSRQESLIATSGNHSCAVLADGSAKCWGNNGSGQLGNNSTDSSVVPVLVTGINGTDAASTALSVSAGTSRTCAVLADGSAKCWGNNASGQLGNGSTDDSVVPVLVTGINGTDAASTALNLSAGSWHTCAVMADGSAKCWGYNGSGQLGDNSTANSLVPVLVTGIDGTDTAPTALSVSVGSLHTCAVMADGSAECWGSNSYGQLGNISTNDSPVPVVVNELFGMYPDRSALSVSTGDFHSCAVLVDGTAKCWGSNSQGQVGNYSNPLIPFPVEVSGLVGMSPATTAVSIGTGGSSSCAVMLDGSAKCWGSNSIGQLGDGTTVTSPVPVPVLGIDGTSESTRIAQGVWANTLEATAPGIPTDVSVSGATSTSLLMSWNAPSSNGGAAITDYVVQYRLASATSWSTFTDSVSPTTMIKVTGLAAASSYEFRVAAVNRVGTGIDTAPYGPVFTLAAPGAPGVPSQVVISNPTRSSVVVSWNAPAYADATEISDYTIQYRKASEMSWTTFVHTPSTATTAMVTGLNALSTYVFRVAAVNPTGTSGWSGLESSLDVGSNHACAVMADGTARCWGRNSNGQLGNDSRTNSRVPVPVIGLSAASPVASISTGTSHSCAVMNNGDVQCWGNNASGQLGNDSNKRSRVPVSVVGMDGTTPTTYALSVSTGSFHSCALMFGGTVKCWGNNDDGQLGNNSAGDSTIPVEVVVIDGLTPARTAVSVSTGEYHSCAVMADGSAKCWGYNASGQLGNDSTTDSRIPVSVVGIDGLTPASYALSVSTSENNSCVMLANGTVKCWGNNDDGQLGNNSAGDSTIPVEVVVIDGLTPARTAVSVSTGDNSSCAVMADGSAKCWGNNDDGQLGNNSTTGSRIPVSVVGIGGLTPAVLAVGVSTGDNSSCAVTVSGAVQCWGYNRYGQLGNNSTTRSSVPVPVSSIDGTLESTRVAQEAAGRTLMAIAPGVPTGVRASNALHSSVVVSWSAPADDGGAAISDYTIQYRKVGELSWTAFAHAASTATTATVTGLSSASTYVFRVAAVNTQGTSVWSGQESLISAGDYHSCAVIANGTVKCWGSGYRGQLGNGTTIDSSVPVPVSGFDGSTPTTTAVSVSTGQFHSCAVMAKGTVRCWGENSDGQLGDGTTTGSTAPVSVVGIDGLTPASTAVNVSTGNAHSCAVMANGTAECWGYNFNGQLGNNSTTKSPVPVPVHGIDGLTPAWSAVSVSTGGYNSCAVMANGTAKCWGAGDLGDGSYSSSPVPVPVWGFDGLTPATTVLSVSGGGSHKCAILKDGTAQCWGGNWFGQLGNSTIEYSALVPVPVSGIDGLTPATTAVGISTGSSPGNYLDPSGDSSCALMADGTAKCWGSNSSGQLGNDSTTNSVVPVPVSGIDGLTPATTAASVSTGGHHTCAVMVNDTAKCWGNNFNGQSGYSSTDDSLVPVSVSGIDGASASTRITQGASARTLVATAPGTPTGLSVSGATNSSLVVAWTAPANNGGSAITDYVVQYRLASASVWSTFTDSVSPATSVTVTGLAAGSSYVFRVAAVNLIDTGSNTDPSSPVSTLAAPGAPGVPVIGVRTTTSVAIFWTAGAANGSAITNYVVEYRKGTGAWTPFTRPAPSSALSVNVTGLEMGGSYTFRVSAVSAGGTGPASVVSAAALAASAPGAPGSLAGAPTTVAGQLKVTWTAASLNGAPSATYKVSWLVGTQWTTPVTATGSTYTITKLRPGTYSVKVTATTVEGSTTATKTGIRLLK